MDKKIYVLMINDTIQGFAYDEETIERVLEERPNSDISIVVVKGKMADEIITKYDTLHMEEDLALTQAEYEFLDASLSQLPIDICCFIDNNIELFDFIKSDESLLIKSTLNLIKNRIIDIESCESDECFEDIFDFEVCRKYIIR